MRLMRHLVLTMALAIGLQSGAFGLGENSPRARSMAGAYTALARGPEAVSWNPANLGLSSSPTFKWELINAGFNIITENNAFSVQTYNDNFTDPEYFIGESEKQDLLSDVPGEGLRFNVDIEPFLALGLPINGGVAFNLPWDLRSAITTSLSVGGEGEIPKDMFELMVFGNQFEADRLELGIDGSYDVSEWDGAGWALGGINWAIAKPIRVRRHEWIDTYFRELAVGATFKMMGGLYGEIIRSGGTGLVARVRGTAIDTYLMTQKAGGVGFGLDLGVAGVLKDGKTTVSASLVDFLDYYNWSIGARQDSIFVKGSGIRVTSILDVQDLEDIFDNPDVDGDGDTDFHQEISNDSFSRSQPARFRFGVSHQLMPRLLLAGNYTQAFSTGFGVETTPRVSAGAEYRLVSWFPTRFGVSVGGRAPSSAFGFAFGPFSLFHMQLQLMDFAYVTRGGLLPGLAKGSQISVMFFRFNLI